MPPLSEEEVEASIPAMLDKMNISRESLDEGTLREGFFTIEDKSAATTISDLDMQVEIQPQENTVGYNILWGYAPDKLYHSYMIFSTEQVVGAMIAGREPYVRVDAFNESGITEGTQIVKIPITYTQADK